MDCISHPMNVRPHLFQVSSDPRGLVEGASYFSVNTRFKSRSERINWRLVAETDVSRITRDYDVDALESILPTLTFCDIEREERYADKEFLKAFQILQLIVEYLLYVQENLVINESHLRKELEHIRRRNETIETQWRSLSTRFEQAKEGPCRFCKESVLTVNVLTKELHTLRQMIADGNQRENELHSKVEKLLLREREYIESKKQSEYEKYQQQMFYRHELDSLKQWIRQEVVSQQVQSAASIKSQEMIETKPLRSSSTTTSLKRSSSNLSVKQAQPQQEVKFHSTTKTSSQKKLAEDDEFDRFEDSDEHDGPKPMEVEKIEKVKEPAKISVDKKSFKELWEEQQQQEREKKAKQEQEQKRRKEEQDEREAKQLNKKKQLDRFNQRRGHLGQTRPSSAQIGKLSVVNKPNAASPSSSDSEEFQRKTSEEEDTAMEEKEPTQPKPSGPIKVVSAPMVRSSTAPTTRTVTVMSTPAQNTKKVEDSESDEEDEDAWMTKYYKQELGIEDDTEPASKSKPLAPVESPKPVVTTATTTTVALTSTVKPTTSTVVSTVPAVVRPSTTPSQPVTYSGGNSSSAQSSWSAKPTSTAPLPSPSFLSSTPTQPASNVTANSTSFRANIQSAPTATANLGQTTTRPTTTPSLSFLSSPAPNPIPSTTVTSVPSEPSAASNKPIWLQGASASSSTAATPKAPPTNPTVDLKLDSTYTPAFTSDLARRRR